MQKINVMGVRFNLRFSKRFNEIHKEFLKVGTEIINDNKLSVEKILEDFGYNPSECNEQFTAKMSFYALLEGKRIPCSKFSQKNLAALLLGKSSVDREKRTGEKFNLEKTNGCFGDGER